MTTNKIVTTQEMSFPSTIADAAADRPPMPMGGPVNRKRDRPAPQLSEALQRKIQERLQTNENAQAAKAVDPVHRVRPPAGPVQEVVDPTYTPTSVTGFNADLPSRFHFYEFKDLFIGDIGPAHFGKLYEAHNTYSMSALCEVISSIITTTHPEYAKRPLAFDLTVGDFYWIMYYIRLNQIPVNMVHSDRCTNPEHLQKVMAGILPEETLEMSSPVGQNDLEVDVLEAVPDVSQFDIPDFIVLKPALMLDIVDQLDDPRYADSGEFRYYCRAATHFTLRDNPHARIAERVEVAKSLSYKALHAIGQYEKLSIPHGVREYVNLTCGECGHQRRSQITVDARSFLPY